MQTATLARLGRIAALGMIATALFSFFLIALRPWFLTWGASETVAHEALPGDELVNASSQSTRAIEIAAPVAEVWPWLLQLGQDRGGFYSYQVLENLAGTDMKSVDVLEPKLQHWKVGDKLWMYPPDKLGGAGHAVLLRFEPERAMVFGTRQIGTALSEAPDGTWAFVLRPVDAAHSLLIVRSRGAPHPHAWQRVLDRLVFEPMHFVMERKMMEGIKARAERQPVSEIGDLIEVVLFAAFFSATVAAAIRLMRWPRARRGGIVVLAAGLAFQMMTFVQPPWVVGLLIILAISALFEYAEAA